MQSSVVQCSVVQCAASGVGNYEYYGVADDDDSYDDDGYDDDDDLHDIILGQG